MRKDKGIKKKKPTKKRKKHKRTHTQEVKKMNNTDPPKNQGLNLGDREY